MLQNKSVSLLCAALLLITGSQLCAADQEEEGILFGQPIGPTESWMQTASRYWNNAKETVSKGIDLGLGLGIWENSRRAAVGNARFTRVMEDLQRYRWNPEQASRLSGKGVDAWSSMIKGVSFAGICTGALIAKKSYDSEKTIQEQSPLFWASSAILGASAACAALTQIKKVRLPKIRWR